MAEIKNELLKSAIADAEAVRETAVANAKMYLEESITPQIRDMIARRLRAEAESDAVDETVDEADVEEAANPHLATDASDFSKVEESAEEVEEGVDEDLEEAAAPEKPHEDADSVPGGGPQDTSGIGTTDNKAPSKQSWNSSGVGTPTADNDPDADHLAEGEELDEWNEADFDLDEVIKELEEDIAAFTQGEGDFVVSEEDDDEEEEVPAEEPEEAPAPEVDAELGDEEDDDEEIDIEEILAELEAEEDELGVDDEADDHEKQAMAAELARLRDEMAQYKEAVSILRGRLQEVNLLNAKLLFTNKMFRKESLTPEQKVRIVESFDRATTVREVKLVYTALVENLSTATKVFNASRKRVVAEGIASKATPSTAPKTEKSDEELIVENTVAKRLQQLAGIIN